MYTIINAIENFIGICDQIQINSNVLTIMTDKLSTACDGNEGCIVFRNGQMEFWLHEENIDQVYYLVNKKLLVIQLRDK